MALLKDAKEITIPECISPYRQLEYVHFNGNDYITTTFDPWNNFGFYLDIKWDSGQTGQFNGHGKVTSNNRAFIGTESGGKVMYGSGAVSASVSNSNVYERHTYQVNTSSGSSGKFFIDGTQIGSNFASNFQETNRGKMYVGGVYRSTGDYSLCKANIYNVRFINNVSTSSTITWNWIPAQRKSDNAIGFLNLASNGTKTFVTSVNSLLEAGPVVNENPDWDKPTVKKIEDSNGDIIWGSQSAFPYRLLEYVHLNGTDNYINTQLKPSYPKNRAIWIKTDSDITATSARVIGSYASASADNARRCYFVVNREGGFGFALGNQWIGGKATSYKNDKVLMYGTINSTGKTTT